MKRKPLQSSRIVQCREIVSHSSCPSIEGSAANLQEQRAQKPAAWSGFLSV
jgi:hypothetical protein